jgi:hypothetical protein
MVTYVHQIDAKYQYKNIINHPLKSIDSNGVILIQIEWFMTRSKWFLTHWIFGLGVGLY